MKKWIYIIIAVALLCGMNWLEFYKSEWHTADMMQGFTSAAMYEKSVATFGIQVKNTPVHEQLWLKWTR